MPRRHIRKKADSKVRTRPSCSIRNTVNYCCENSTLHCLSYLGTTEKLPLSHRYLWFLKIFIAMGLSVWMCLIAYFSSQESPIITRIDSSTSPVSEIYFPAVTVCNINKVSRNNFVNISNILKNNGISDEDIKNFAMSLEALSSLNTFKYVDQNRDINRRIFPILNRYNYSIDSIMKEVSQKCDDLLHYCEFKELPFHCSKNFLTVKSVEGYCCSFNYLGPGDLKTKKNEVKPEVVDGGGVSNGLLMVLNINSKDYVAPSKPHIGAVLMLSNPLDYPEISTKSVTVELHVSLQMRVEPFKVNSTSLIRGVPLQVRRCKFGDEIISETYSDYSFQTCMIECKVNFIYKTCNCIPYYYPNPENKTTCNVHDLKCLLKYKGLFNSLVFPSNEKFENSVPCDCMPECNDMSYKITAHQENINKSYIYHTMQSMSFLDKSIVTVFYPKSTCVTYEKDLIIYWNEMFATYGGLFGLFIGGSVLSLIELVFKFVKSLIVKKIVKENEEIKYFPFTH